LIDFETLEPNKMPQAQQISPSSRPGPRAENGTVRFGEVGEPIKPPRRQPNLDRRPREYLTPAEVEALMTTARKRGRYGHRNATMILVAYCHGLRVGELVRLVWDQVDFPQGLLHVTRLKRGVPSVHPLTGDEIRALRRLRREQPDGRHIFQTERKAPMTEAGVRKTLARIGEAAGFPWLVHPHQLRHGCGYKLANDGRDTRALQHYLGHRNIQHTTRYTELASGRFDGWWS
jgi:integrase